MQLFLLAFMGWFIFNMIANAGFLGWDMEENEVKVEQSNCLSDDGLTDLCDDNLIHSMLRDVGDGLGGLFDSLGNPLGNFLIVVGIAVGVVALFMGIASGIRMGL
jgi:hypothetical protein